MRQPSLPLGTGKRAKQRLGHWTCLQRYYPKISSASSTEQSFGTSFSTNWSAASAGPSGSALALASSVARAHCWGSNSASVWFRLGCCCWDINLGEKKLYSNECSSFSIEVREISVHLCILFSREWNYRSVKNNLFYWVIFCNHQPSDTCTIFFFQNLNVWIFSIVKKVENFITFSKEIFWHFPFK